jgi:hypothetical protein
LDPVPPPSTAPVSGSNADSDSASEQSTGGDITQQPPPVLDILPDLITPDHLGGACCLQHPARTGRSAPSGALPLRERQPAWVATAEVPAGPRLSATCIKRNLACTNSSSSRLAPRTESIDVGATICSTAAGCEAISWQRRALAVQTRRHPPAACTCTWEETGETRRALGMPWGSIDKQLKTSWLSRTAPLSGRCAECVAEPAAQPQPAATNTNL